MRLSRQFQFFLQKNFDPTKVQIKPKPTNKTKLSQQKTTKATAFLRIKSSKRVKIVCIVLLKKI